MRQETSAGACLTSTSPAGKRRTLVICISTCSSVFLQTAHASRVICAREPISPSVSGCRGTTGLAICSGVSKPGGCAAVAIAKIPDRDNASSCEDGRRDGGRGGGGEEGGGRADGSLIAAHSGHVCPHIKADFFFFFYFSFRPRQEAQRAPL